VPQGPSKPTVDRFGLERSNVSESFEDKLRLDQNFTVAESPQQCVGIGRMMSGRKTAGKTRKSFGILLGLVFQHMRQFDRAAPKGLPICLIDTEAFRKPVDLLRRA
jgi:hypothetical protein